VSDCKSAHVSVRWFESSPAHQLKIRELREIVAPFVFPKNVRMGRRWADFVHLPWLRMAYVVLNPLMFLGGKYTNERLLPQKNDTFELNLNRGESVNLMS